MNGEMPEGEARSGADRPGTPTRGFLFADLRGYTEFVERNGAAAAAGLLERFRALVRAGPCVPVRALGGGR